MLKKILPLLLIVPLHGGFASEEPNVVFIITDDQGYGDLACHGNPVIKTPNIDKLYSESIRLTDYHVSPTCTPTRAALMTGRYTNRTGAWHTIMGRSILRTNETTIADHLSKAGLVTGIFGKWHLGDGYPYDPQYRGFQKTYIHGGGGIGQTPDVWDNSYFDDTYLEDGELTQAKGFCTDVFFEEATEFIEKQVEAKKPFFAYISTNAPHGPYNAPQKYLDMYPELEGKTQSFFAMITNIDDNVGQLRARLAEIGAADNTIFIFTTDNGTAGGSKVFNAGMRGNKGSNLEGGHRVPFFMHWPAKGWNEGRDVGTLSAHIDVLPTFAEIFDFSLEDSLPVDGKSILPVLTSSDADWSDRIIYTDSQRNITPVEYKNCSIMSQDWRLINGKQLYQISKDPSQENNVADKHPERVASMRKSYEETWDDMEESFAEGAPFHLGENPKPLSLTAHDLVGTGGTASVAWNQQYIREGKLTGINEDGPAYWQIKVTKAGKYTFELSRYPLYTGIALNASAPTGSQVPGDSKSFRTFEARAFDIKSGYISLNGKVLASAEAEPDAASITLTAELPVGTHQLSAIFETPDGENVAYYTVIKAAE
ncbi:MAG: arylsulfatase [Akkermansiaceae bacterium]|jgi:arylsulfatase A-like enzyme|nr:arylsulfatase [Akkermansiaceae bacterium]MDP4647633.1 arylsulfatase [Akkermansiaceae bacterium]MDP4722309.1 arylsulfatase [Akkermansiaceae bacterium]MDP4780349.1 arylsulfatase [Akkermansiaceae bacterium]MDP4846168.1 arylsulfatase [Akkermansiaceae bacterium]